MFWARSRIGTRDWLKAFRTSSSKHHNKAHPVIALQCRSIQPVGKAGQVALELVTWTITTFLTGCTLPSCPAKTWTLPAVLLWNTDMWDITAIWPYDNVWLEIMLMSSLSRQKLNTTFLKSHNFIRLNCTVNYNKNCSVRRIEPLVTVWTKNVDNCSSVIIWNLLPLQYNYMTLCVLR